MNRLEQMPITSKDFNDIVLALNDVVIRVPGGSTLDGLTVLTVALGALLDTYAKPNPNNKAGMCDDPAAFRAYFAGILTEGTDEAVTPDHKPERQQRKRKDHSHA